MGVAVSPPCDLKESSLLFSKGWNRIYEQYFLKQLKRKVIEKEKKYPNILKEIGISIEKVQKATSLVEFDHLVTSRSEEHTSELQSRQYLVCRLLLEKKKKNY